MRNTNADIIMLMLLAVYRAATETITYYTPIVYQLGMNRIPGKDYRYKKPVL